MLDINLLSSDKKEKGPDVNTKGSGRTTCHVFIDTHDKGPHQTNQRIDLSEHITQVSMAQHITGGGSANIMLPAIDHIEDYISAGDIVNIYFNINRVDVDAYNIGNVRTFFGYVDSVHKGVSVDGAGVKRTNYTINCADFTKAFKDTQIYNNPYLASQGESGSPDVIRDDLKDNLGGIALYSMGISTEGGPRELIIRNSMRMLGMGGQWVLPEHYNETLDGAQHWFTLSSKEATAPKGIAALRAMAIGVALKTKEVQGADGSLLFETDKLIAQEAIMAEVKKLEESKLRAFFGEQATYKKVSYSATINSDGSSATQDIGNTLFKLGPKDQVNSENEISVSVFDIELIPGGSGDNTQKNSSLKKEVIEIAAAVATEIHGLSSFKHRPKINYKATPGWSSSAFTPARTLFNILSLDYIEEVDGMWGGFAMLEFQGSLWNALESSANTVVNEFFMDLRPVADFKQRSKDGLQTKMEGALPMVPAIILREKPFTNYSNSVTQNGVNLPNEGQGITVGTLKKGDGYDDQLFASIAGPTNSIQNVGVGKKESVEKSVDEQSHLADMVKEETFFDYGVHAANLKAIADKIDSTTGYPLFHNQSEGLHRFLTSAQKKLNEADKDEVVAAYTSLLDNLKKKAEKKGLDLSDVSTLSKKQLNSIVKGTTLDAQDISKLTSIFGGANELVKGKEVLYLIDQKAIIQKKNIGTIFALPRPVFRTPDGTRLVIDRQVVSNIGALGHESLSGGDFTPFVSIHDPGSNEALEFAHGGEKVTGVMDIGKDTIMENMSKSPERDKRFHILDSVTVYAQDVKSHQYSRGDGNIINMLEIFANLPGGIEAQRYFMNNFIPIVTPIHVQRFGVRVATHQTKFVQHHVGGSSTPFAFQAILLTRWAMMLDMWYQHNHEYLSGSMSLRGLPGIRVGYRLDRPDLNLSFYVEGVSHTWSYPGSLNTSVTVSRGQPLATAGEMGAGQALPYYPPEPNVRAGSQRRQALGQIFSANKKAGKEKYPIPGTYTGSLGTGGLQIEPRPGGESFLEEAFDTFFSTT